MDNKHLLMIETGIKSVKENNNYIRKLFLEFDIKNFHHANVDIETIRE